MGLYFEYRDWDIEDLCYSIRERLHKSKKPIPKKIWKHSVSIVYRTGENCYSYPNYGWYQLSNLPDFNTREEAEKYLDSLKWLVREGDIWIDEHERHTYITKDEKTIPYHYEIRESDYETWEDGNYYIEYSEEEKKALSDALYWVEKARIYMGTYDHCSDQGSFGDGRFSDELKRELEKFESSYTEDYSEDYEEDE